MPRHELNYRAASELAKTARGAGFSASVFKVAQGLAVVDVTNPATRETDRLRSWRDWSVYQRAQTEEKERLC